MEGRSAVRLYVHARRQAARHHAVTREHGTQTCAPPPLPGMRLTPCQRRGSASRPSRASAERPDTPACSALPPSSASPAARAWNSRTEWSSLTDASMSSAPLAAAPSPAPAMPPAPAAPPAQPAASCSSSCPATPVPAAGPAPSPAPDPSAAPQACLPPAPPKPSASCQHSRRTAAQCRTCSGALHTRCAPARAARAPVSLFGVAGTSLRRTAAL